jgi:polysaccharide export outer membrane protein
MCMKLMFSLVVFVYLSLSGCTVLPGSSARFTETEIADGPDQQNYTLLKITPNLITKLQRDEQLKAKQVSGTGPLGDSSSIYRLGPQDSLRIFVWGNPDLSLVAIATNGTASTPVGRTIDEKGNLFFPLVGVMHVSGMTVSEFRQELTSKLSKYIKNPQIDVDVAGFRSQKVFISGEVKTPGVIPITDQPMRITDAIGLAGGITGEADLYNLVLTRGSVSTKVDLDRIYYSGDVSANIVLKNGDVLGIPDRQSRKVFVLGEVGNSVGTNQSRSYVMRRGKMSLTEVLSDAGGLNPYSSAASKVYVMRADENGDPVIFRLDGKDPTSLVMAEQFTIRPRDVVFISATDVTEIGRFINQFFPLTSAASSGTSISSNLK